MKKRANAYLATLIITIFGAGAALIIIKVANKNQYQVVQGSNEANYAQLQNSILKSRVLGGN